jgi:hypothetical protein
MSRQEVDYVAQLETVKTDYTRILEMALEIAEMENRGLRLGYVEIAHRLVRDVYHGLDHFTNRWNVVNTAIDSVRPVLRDKTEELTRLIFEIRDKLKEKKK